MTKLNTSALALLSALTLSAASAMPASTQLVSLGAPTSGTVSVSTVAGKTTVTIKGLKTEVGPDLEVRLYKLSAPKNGEKSVYLKDTPSVKIGVLKKFSGDFSFTLPAGIKINDYKSLVIWCELVGYAFGAAPLK